MPNKTKILILSISIFLFINLSTYGQCKDSACCNNNSLQKHSWSMQFAVGSNFTLQSFDGLMLSLKYHFTKKSAVRFGIGFSGNSQNGTESNTQGAVDIKNNYQNIYFYSNYILYPSPGSKVNFYIGAGPRASYSHSLDEFLSSSTNTIYSDEYTSWATGLQLICGAEWFAVNWLSLFGEYLAYGTYGKTERKSYDYDYYGNHIRTKSNSNDWIFNGSTARLGLSVYF